MSDETENLLQKFIKKRKNNIARAINAIISYTKNTKEIMDLKKHEFIVNDHIYNKFMLFLSIDKFDRKITAVFLHGRMWGNEALSAAKFVIFKIL